MRRPDMTIAQILEWIDIFYKRFSRWPKKDSGRIPGSLGETWLAVEMALRNCGRGLTIKGSSLARLLAEHRGVRNRMQLPDFFIPKILAWADAHFKRTGSWPVITSGPVVGAPGETWMAVNHALGRGTRGLPGGSSLAKLLVKERGIRRSQNLGKLTVKLILKWADAYYRRIGNWPDEHSGPINEGPPGETWYLVNQSLIQGFRTLPPGGSLARLLAAHRGKRNRKDLPRLTVKQILAWADAHCTRTGQWPTVRSGSIAEGPGETWGAVQSALQHGGRGFAGGDTLYRLLVRYRRIKIPA